MRKGQKQTPEARAKISEAMQGKRNAAGHTVTEKQKANLNRRWLFPVRPQAK